MTQLRKLEESDDAILKYPELVDYLPQISGDWRQISLLAKEWNALARQKSKRVLKKVLREEAHVRTWIDASSNANDVTSLFYFAAKWIRQREVNYFSAIVKVAETLPLLWFPPTQISEQTFDLEVKGQKRPHTIWIKSWVKGEAIVVEQRGWGRESRTMGLIPGRSEPASDLSHRLPELSRYLQDAKMTGRCKRVYLRRVWPVVKDEQWFFLATSRTEESHQVHPGLALFDVLAAICHPSARPLIQEFVNLLFGKMGGTKPREMLEWAATEDMRILP